MTLTSLAALSLLAAAPPDPTLAIKHRYEQLGTVTKQLDATGVALWLKANTTEDLSWRTSRGVSMGQADLAGSQRDLFLILKKVTGWKYRLTNIAVHPNHISCTANVDFAAVTKGKKSYRDSTITVETWNKLNGQWKLAVAVTTSERTTLIGKGVG
jgi:hypothetical protein